MHKDKNPPSQFCFMLSCCRFTATNTFRSTFCSRIPQMAGPFSCRQPHLAEGILKQVTTATHAGRAACFWRCAPSNRLPVPACPAEPPYATMVTVWWSAAVTHRCRLTPWDPQLLHGSTRELTWVHWKHWILVPSEIWASCQILNKS